MNILSYIRISLKSCRMTSRIKFQKRFMTLAGLILIFICFNSCSPVKPSLDSYRKVSSLKKNKPELREQLIESARNQLGCKYKNAGKLRSGFDCSGLVQYVFQQFRISMASSAHQQSLAGTGIEIHSAKPGDLIFFGTKQKVSHVGIISLNQRNKLTVIHSTSSLGVIEENILESDYWLKRIQKLVALDSYLEERDISFRN